MLMSKVKRWQKLKTGIFCDTLLDIDFLTFQEHLRLTRLQFDYILCILDRKRRQQLGTHSSWGGGSSPCYTQATVVDGFVVPS